MGKNGISPSYSLHRINTKRSTTAVEKQRKKPLIVIYESNTDISNYLRHRNLEISHRFASTDNETTLDGLIKNGKPVGIVIDAEMQNAQCADEFIREAYKGTPVFLVGKCDLGMVVNHLQSQYRIQS